MGSIDRSDKAANILALIGGGGLVGWILMGAVGDRIGHKQTYLTGFIIMLVTLISLMVIKEVWLFYLFAVVFGFAYGSLSALLSPLAADLFGLRSLGIIVATASTAWTIGGALGPVIAGHIFDVSGSYQLAFIISILVCSLGLIATSLIEVQNHH